MKIKQLLTTLSFAFWLHHCLAETAEEKGLAIAQEIEHRNSGYGDTKVDMKMILRNSNGEESIRDLKMDTLEVKDDGDKSLSTFDSPADVKGTAFLSFTHALEPDEQWLYLPALKRVKRISSSNKSGPFLGSEYAFEDLTSFEIPKYKYHYIRDEKLADADCYVVEMTPQYEESGYSKLISWVDKTRYIPLKTDYFDRKESLLKTLDFKGYKQYLNQFWRADEMLMTNHQTGKNTSLLSSNYRFRTGLTDRDFDQNTLNDLNNVIICLILFCFSNTLLKIIKTKPAQTMKTYVKQLFVIALAMLANVKAYGWELSGYTGVEDLGFMQGPQDYRQHDNYVSGVLEPRLDHKWDNDKQSFAFVPFTDIPNTTIAALTLISENSPTLRPPKNGNCGSDLGKSSGG